MAEAIARRIEGLLGITVEHAWFVLGALVGLALGLLLRRRRPAATDAAIGMASSAGDAAPRGARATAGAGADPVGRMGLEDAMVRAVQELLREGRKIDAIRRVRESTGVGLAEAKALVEALESRGGAAGTGSPGGFGG